MFFATQPFLESVELIGRATSLPPPLADTMPGPERRCSRLGVRRPHSPQALTRSGGSIRYDENLDSAFVLLWWSGRRALAAMYSPKLECVIRAKVSDNDSTPYSKRETAAGK